MKELYKLGLAALTLSASSVIAQDWNTLGSGIIKDIRSFDTDTVKNILYAGGDIDTAGGNPASHVVSWDGIQWDTLGLGFDDHIDAVKIFDGDVWVAGDFAVAPGGVSVGYVARYNDTSWSSPGLGMDNFVYALEEFNGDLYAGGDFTMADGSSAKFIAGWNGTNWFNLGAGLNGTVNTMAVYNGELYAGGGFDSAGGAPANYVAKWNGTSWSALGAGTDYRIYDMAVYNGELYVAGWFNNAGGLPASNIAKWNGTNWAPVSTGISGGALPFVTALTVYGGSLFAGGNFDLAGGTVVNDLARWDGLTWSDVSGGVSGGADDVRALGVFRDQLMVGGRFDTVGVSTLANNVASWTMLAPGSEFISSDTLVCEGGCINFFDQSTGGPTSWQWSFTGGTPATSTAQHPTVCFNTAGVYDVQLITSNSMGSDTIIKTAYVSIEANPSASINPGDTTFCSGNSITYTASPSSGYSYQWFMNGSPLTSDTLSTYTTSTAGTYSVAVTSPLGCSATSGNSILTLSTAPPTPNISKVNNKLVTISGSYTYQWFLNGAPIPGANTSSYQPVVNGLYTVTITNTSGCSSTSNNYQWISTSIADADKEIFRLYPNPASEVVHINVALDKPVNAQLFDNIGRLVKTMELKPGDNQIELTDIPAGIYFLTGATTKQPVKFSVIK